MGLYFSISGLLFIIILMYNFFSKERINSLETKIYKYMIILTSFGLLLDIITCIIFNAGLDYHSIAYVFASKFVFAYFVVWFLLFAFYIKSISITNVDNRKNLLNTTFYLFIILFFIVIPFILSYLLIMNLLIMLLFLKVYQYY